MRRRFLRDESGFTLSEMMVTMAIMLVVLFAIYGVFDMSVRIFSFGNDKVEAVENARLGLGRMEREIRAAYPQSVTNSTLLTTQGQSQITFGNETGAWDSGISTAETISYSVNANNQLVRSQGGAAAQPVVEPLTGNGLQFRYCRTPTDCPVSAPPENEVQIVRITLTINVDGREQTLTTDVDLRNR